MDAAKIIRGYEYAKRKHALLGDTALSVLTNEVECSRDFDDYDEFDKGIEKYLKEQE